jgi:hypothetical protein
MHMQCARGDKCILLHAASGNYHLMHLGRAVGLALFDSQPANEAAAAEGAHAINCDLRVVIATALHGYLEILHYRFERVPSVNFIELRV